MAKNSCLTAKILALAIIFVALGWLVSAKYNTTSMEEQTTNELKTIHKVLTVVEEKEQVSQRPAIITDRYVNKATTQGKTVTMGTDGSIWNVQNGVVLADNLIIEKSEESSSVVRLHQLRNSNTQHDFN